MTRVTEKALRPRQYVFQHVSQDHRPDFVRRIRSIRKAEQRKMMATHMEGDSVEEGADTGRSESLHLIEELENEASALMEKRRRLLEVIAQGETEGTEDWGTAMERVIEGGFLSFERNDWNCSRLPCLRASLINDIEHLMDSFVVMQALGSFSRLYQTSINPSLPS